MSLPTVQRILTPFIQLSAETDGAEPRPIWIQAAVEGVWRARKPPVELTPELFSKVIANFRALEGYRAGADGIGCEPVVPLDYEHASEFFKALLRSNPGAILQTKVPQEGVPTPGMILDLATRRGGDGKVQMWAYVIPGKKLWDGIASGEQNWTSIAVDTNAIDRQGQPIGPALTSLAITNDPFIRGMERLGVSMQRALAENKPQRIAASFGGAVLLSDGSEVFGSWLTDEAEIPSADGGTPSAVPQASNRQTEVVTRDAPMTKPLSARLAPVLKLSAEATEDDVTDSVRVLAAQSTRLTASLRRVLKLADGATDEEMVGAVESAVSGAADAESAKELASAFEELKAALGAANIPELLARCTKLIQQAKENEGLVESLSSQLSGIKSQLSQAEVKDAKAQIAALSASHGVDPKGVMMMLTSAIGTDEKGVEFVRPGSLEGIFKVYPPSEAKPAASVAVPDALKTLLTSSVVAGPGGEQRGGVVTGVATAPVQAAAVDDSAHAKVQADIMLCSGFNHVEKTVSYLLGKEKRFEELAPADQIRVASRFYTSGQLLI